MATPPTKSDYPYKAFSNNTYRQIPQIQGIDQQLLKEIDVVASVLPFKVNSYVINELIDWNNIPHDPIFTLTFPRREMLEEEHYAKMEALIDRKATAQELKAAAMEVRMELNPHPSGQTNNLPELDGQVLPGIQHKYNETALFFPAQGQTCHAYCTFCFRWPQFVGMNDLKFAMKEVDLLIKYLQEHPEITDVLFTGGDPMIMKTRILKTYIEPLLEAKIPTLKTIRIGTKALGYWPYRFTSDDDAPELMELFDQVRQAGLHLSIMAHFNHSVELTTPAVKEATAALRAVGAQIRTQSPLLRHINDDPDVWAEMWKEQVNMGMIPYYMFVERDTGSKQFFEVPLEYAYELFRAAYTQVSGICRTVRGPSMSANPGKVEILGVSKIHGEKVFVLRFLQARDAEWVDKPFFAKYDSNAYWLNHLKPAFGEDRFFFEDRLDEILGESTSEALFVNN